MTSAEFQALNELIQATVRWDRAMRSVYKSTADKLNESVVYEQAIRTAQIVLVQETEG